MFHSFVVLADMRTGSNFLEANLNALDGVACHGEAFNPHFIGYPNRREILGLDQRTRDAAPERLLAAIRDAPGMNGFRFFQDHDARALDAVMADPGCAKIVLARNPLDSYISWKIARSTNQWKLTDVERRKSAKPVFEADEFARFLGAMEAFQQDVLRRLQVSGQSAFWLAYEDLQDLDVLNGLAAWLGVAARLGALDQSLKVQNPGPAEEKVANPGVMREALADLDRFNLSRVPNFEPRRGAAVPSYVACPQTPLLFLPIPGAPVEPVRQWLAALDRVAPEALVDRMTQKTLRRWKREHPGHRSFTLLRHPALRAHEVFCRRILATGPGSYAKIRQTLRQHHGLPVPEGAPGPGWDARAHRAAFEQFLSFVQKNLAGQTAIRADAAWASQSQVLASFSDVALPDHVLREDRMARDLARLAEDAGHAAPPRIEPEAEAGPFRLSEIHDAALESTIAETYQRDYLTLGFAPWQAG